MTEQTQTLNNHVDYKNVMKLKANLNPHSRIHSRRRTHMNARAQRDFARAVKRARFMALVPFIQY